MSNFSPLLIGEPRAAAMRRAAAAQRLYFSPLLIGEPRAAASLAAND